MQISTSELGWKFLVLTETRPDAGNNDNVNGQELWVRNYYNVGNIRKDKINFMLFFIIVDLYTKYTKYTQQSIISVYL